MPRCYMVKKDLSPLGGTPPCSPTEASVAPPCYTPDDHHTITGPRAAAHPEEARHVGTQYEEPRSGDFADASGGESTAPSAARADRNGLYTVLRAAQYADCPEPLANHAEPRTVRYLEREPSPTPYHDPYDQPGVTEYEVVEADAPQLTEYRVVAESEQKASEYSPVGGERAKQAEYAELQSSVRERSAADTEAAHELLSLAAGVPPLPPAPVLTVLEPASPLPLYTYALHPTNIYIIAEEPTSNNIYATLTPLQQVEYTAQPQVSTYIIQEGVGGQPPLHYQPLYEGGTDVAVPVSVIESAPAALEPVPTPVPASPGVPIAVHVPVIEPVPVSDPVPVVDSVPAPAASAPEPADDTDSDESVPLCNIVKKNKYNCNECGKRYATSSNLSRHKQTHRSLDSQAAKRCGECGKAYVSMPALAMHVLTHRMGHVCGVCGKQFSRPWLLRGHLRSHTGEKPYSCPSCSKSFADRSNLRAHLQTHAADKRWECTRCNKSFALKSYLNKHQEAACTQDDDEAH